MRRAGNFHQDGAIIRAYRVATDELLEEALLRFAWDAANVAHIERHGVTAEEAEQILDHKAVFVAGHLRNGEEREVYLGETDTGRVLVVVLTQRDGFARVVAADPADRATRRCFASKFASKKQASDA